jgi:hypothetical protein
LVPPDNSGVSSRIRIALAVAAYLGLAEAWTYVVLNTARQDYGFWNSWKVFAGVQLLQVLLGLAAADFRILFVPLLAVLLAEPAGGFADGYPEVPVWFYAGVHLVVFGAISTTLGAVIGRRLERADAPGASP